MIRHWWQWWQNLLDCVGWHLNLVRFVREAACKGGMCEVMEFTSSVNVSGITVTIHGKFLDIVKLLRLGLRI